MCSSDLTGVQRTLQSLAIGLNLLHQRKIHNASFERCTPEPTQHPPQ